MMIWLQQQSDQEGYGTFKCTWTESAELIAGNFVRWHNGVVNGVVASISSEQGGEIKTENSLRVATLIAKFSAI